MTKGRDGAEPNTWFLGPILYAGVRLAHLRKLSLLSCSLDTHCGMSTVFE